MKNTKLKSKFKKVLLACEKEYKNVISLKNTLHGNANNDSR